MNTPSTISPRPTMIIVRSTMVRASMLVVIRTGHVCTATRWKVFGRLRSWRRPPLLLLYDAKAPNCRKNKAFKGLGHYAEWPKVADAVIKAERGYPQHGRWHTP